MVWLDIIVNALRTSLGLTAAAYAIAGIGLNLQFGYTGLLNLGHAASMMVGAYGTAIAAENGVPLVPSIIIGIVAAVLVGLILGLFTLRLRFEFLGIITIAFAEILRFVIRSSWADPVTKSVFGIQGFGSGFYDINPIPAGKYGIGNFNFTDEALWLMLIAWPAAILLTLLLRTMLNSPWGRVIKAVREDEEVVRSLGKNVFLYKLQSFCIGGAIGALAGILLAIEQQNVHPNFFLPLLTFYVYTLIILGGVSKTWGPVVGAIIFWFIFDFLEGFTRDILIADNWLGNLVQLEDAGAIRVALVGVGLVLLMIFKPEGILGKKEGAVSNE